jgi:hypothetical protein
MKRSMRLENISLAALNETLSEMRMPTDAREFA